MITHRFSVAEYHHLGELGLLNERTELIDGIITDMEPIGPWHADIVDVQARKLTRFVQGGVEQPASGSSISPAMFPDVSIDLTELLE
jgi:hypothetical protein